MSQINQVFLSVVVG